MSAALPQAPDTAYLAVMTPRIARLDSRALMRVSGPDARPFLHNLLTQDVESLASGELRFGALLSPPGRLLFDLFLWGEADGVLLDVAADRREALGQRLNLYRLRAAVTVEPVDGPVFACWPQFVTGFAPDPRTPLLGGRHYGDAVANAAEEAWDAHRVDLGVPGPADWGSDATYPIEADFDLLHGIDFAKGCFVGQETTSRMKRRGAIRNRMLALDIAGDAAPAGAEVLNGDRRVGQVTSSRPGAAMALLRLDRLDGDLTVDGRPATVRLPDWAPAAAFNPGPAPSQG